MPMPKRPMDETKTIRFEGHNIDLEEALDIEKNIVQRREFQLQRQHLEQDLFKQKPVIEALVAHHLGKRKNECKVRQPKKWIRGGFNVCIPVLIEKDGRPHREVLMRVPYQMLAEMADEKVSSEVATYAYVQEFCPDIPTPHLWGFGFADGCHYTHTDHCSLYRWFSRMVQRYFCSLMGYPVPTLYTKNPNSLHINSSYIIVDYIQPATATTLSLSWAQHKANPIKRRNLFKGLSTVMLSLAQANWPSIGSFAFNEDGTITLTNRPLLCDMALLENRGVPRIMDRTYPCTDSFVSDLITTQDLSFLHQPHTQQNETDGRAQMAVRVLMRAISHHFFDRRSRNGPFYLGFTDLNRSNFFVDENWNLKYIIDLEWICTLPLELIRTPDWLSGRHFNDLSDEVLPKYDQVRHEFMTIFQETEEELFPKKKGGLLQSEIMNRSWKRGTYWFGLALMSVSGLDYIFEQHICKKYRDELPSTSEDKMLSQFWSPDSSEIIERKSSDRKEYEVELKKLFQG